MYSRSGAVAYVENGSTYSEKDMSGLNSISMAKFSRRFSALSVNELGITLHDLHFNFCRDTATESGEAAVWHIVF